jgi:hypothetical protein
LEACRLVEVQRLDLYKLVEVDLYQLVVVQQWLVGLEVYLLEVTQSTMACMLLRCSVKLVMLLAANRNRATLVLGIRGLHKYCIFISGKFEH